MLCVLSSKTTASALMRLRHGPPIVAGWHGREAARLALALEPDVAVLDIAMPLLSGIEATRQILRRLPTVGVLILSMHSEEAFITQALQAGARGYLLKDSADADLIHDVTAVGGGSRSSVLRPPR